MALIYTSLSKHKNLEIETGYQPLTTCCEWFDFGILWSRKCDHAGFEIRIDILGVWFRFNIYDHRHWNHNKKRWYKNKEKWTKSKYY